MTHPKMQYTYVGVDSHKDFHIAVFIDCFFEKLGEIRFDNRPSKFEAFLEESRTFQAEGTALLFGLEDVGSYGRPLAVFLKANGQRIKNVNALLVKRERQNQNVSHKTDTGDAECTARVLLSKFGELSDAEPQDKYWILRTLVIRRDFIVKNNTSLKKHLHYLLMAHYPRYRDFFEDIGCMTSLAFFMRFPSPSALENTTFEELTGFLRDCSKGRLGAETAEKIWHSFEDTAVQYQEIRDAAVQSAIRQIQFNLKERERLEKSIALFLSQFDCPLTSMTGIDIITAAQLLSCIGDIKRFPTPAKLARYSGVAPVSYSSGKKDVQFVNKRGNRELNSLFYCLAVRLVATAGPNHKVVNHFFYEYYRRKLSDGKTKKQALKCVQRRLVNIIWTMLTNNEEYVNPPMYDAPKKKAL